MVARKSTTNGNGKTDMTTMAEQEIIATEKEHLGDIDAATGIYAETDETFTPTSSIEEPCPVPCFSTTQSDTPMMRLVKALVKARAEFDSVTKNAANPYFKSKYADLSEVMGAITPALCNNGLVIVQPLEQKETGLLLRTQLYHIGGAMLESTFAIPDNKDMQKLGGAITYARRYCVSSLMGVAPEDDDGNSATGKSSSNKEPVDNSELLVVYGKLFSSCNDAASLKDAFLDAVNTVPTHKAVITSCKDARKKELGIE